MVLRVAYKKNHSTRRTRSNEIKRAALSMIEDEVDRWVMRCQPEYREEVKKRILTRMLSK